VTEWNFDRNPDVVSWLGGMLVRPVLGVPFSESNLTLFRALNAKSVFVVTMNTGQVLQFTYQDTQQIPRTDTRHFRQDTPGLALVLIGETFDDGMPTDLRYWIEATYPSDQEVARLSADAPDVVPMGTVRDLDGLTLAVQAARWMPSPELPPDVGLVQIDLQLQTHADDLNPSTIQPLLLIGSQQIASDPNAARVGNCAPLESVIPANTATCVTLGFVAARSNNARLQIGGGLFDIPITLPEEVVDSARLDIQLERVARTDIRLQVAARIFNPTDQPIPLTAQDFALELGFIPNPSGMRVNPVFESIWVAPGAAVDVALVFPYAGEGFATLTLLERVWSVEV
jgi:hypothetical protein